MRRMYRTSRRSAQVEAIAPWVALTVILLMWWAGAHTIHWLLPRSSGPAAALGPAELSRDVPKTKPLDEPAPKTGVLVVGTAHGEPTLTADVAVSGNDIAQLRTRGLMIPVRGIS